MKRILIFLFFALTASASAQFALVGAWNSAAAASGTDTVWTNPDSLKLLFFARDLADSLGKSSGDTTYILLNRARWLEQFTHGNGYQLTDALKPKYNADSNAVLFDGIDDYASFASASLFPQPSTVIVVLRYPEGPSGTKFIYDGTSATNRHGLYKAVAESRVFAGTANVWAATYPADSLAVITATFNGANSSVRVNGAVRHVGNYGAQGLIGMIFGAATDASADGKFALRMAAVYHKVLTDLQVSNIEHEVKDLYGVALP